MNNEDDWIPDENEEKTEALRGFNHPGLMCQVESIEYNFLEQEGMLYMPSHNCCDMNGCIKLFESIDVKVRKIQTFTNKVPDVCYILTDSGWKAKFFKWKQIKF